MSSEVEKLEKSVIDLGAEVFKLRHEMAEMRDYHSHLAEIICELRSLLRDRGAITAADLDACVAGNKDASFGADSFEQQLDEFEGIPTSRKRVSH